MTLLPVMPAHALATVAEEQRWLIEGLWASTAVGIIGGEPKCCKSFLALEMAVSVAAGVSALGRFRSVERGRVLLFAAEDALHVVRRRLDGIARASGVELLGLDIQVITAPSLRLDVAADRERLRATVAALRPRLLILDPLVRLHRIDENVASEVAPLLGYLRELERGFAVAVVLVHHAKKGANAARAGQALRGSSELHAWGDSNLYLRRQGETLMLTIEHRAAASHGGIALGLEALGCALALRVRDTPAATQPAPPVSTEQRIERALAGSTSPLGVAALRDRCHLRTQSVCDALAALVTAGRVSKIDGGYCLTTPTAP